jgi:hypothetical protein
MEDLRARRWVVRGALILAGLAIFFGLLFSVFIAIVLNQTPSEGVLAFWLRLVATTALIWGLGGAFFGSILGAFASMIWKPRD